MQLWEGRHDVGQHRLGLADRDDSFPLGPGESVGDLGEKDVGSNQLVDGVLEISTQPLGLRSVGLDEDPLQHDIRVYCVFHSSSRISRIRSTATLSKPCLRKISWLMASERARTRRATSRSTGRPAATASKTS